MDFAKLDITDDVVFACVMQDADICKCMLEYLLPELKISKIEYLAENGERMEPQPQVQRFFAESVSHRGVRLDVYLDDGRTVYNIEMQTGAMPLAKRARLYQAHIDINQLSRGSDYEELKPCYVIFICTFDPFDEDRYVYTFQNTCDQIPGKRLEDGTYKCFFNTGGHVGEIPERLRQLLAYMNDTAAYNVEQTENELIRRIHDRVAFLKQDDDWRNEYMVYELKMRDKLMEGRKEGIKEGRAGILLKMLQSGMTCEAVAGMCDVPIAEVRALAAQA